MSPTLGMLAIALEEIKGDVKVIKANQIYISNDVQAKHIENRADIVELKKDVGVLKLQYAKASGWAAGVAAVLTIALHYLDKSLK